MSAGLVTFALADEIAWGDVAGDGSVNNRALDVPVATARGAENLYISNPMDSHDWTHTSIVRNSLKAQLKATSKLVEFEEALRPIFTAMPKDPEGRLSSATARYALHRFFSKKHGWAIKGLQPAGAAWAATMSVTPDVKDVTKYMVPTYLQQLLSATLGVTNFDLHALAALAASLDHLVHAEMIRMLYDVFTTLELPTAGKRTEAEVDQILDTLMMVYAFGVNLEVSVKEDVRKAKVHLDTRHSGWQALQDFAKDVKKKTSSRTELDFAQLVQVVEKIGENYVKWQGKDCLRAKQELGAKHNHKQGRVELSELRQSEATGRRLLFTETANDFKKLGVLSHDSDTELIIPNFINSQSMCLSTASFYTACCVNECEGLLSKLEKEVAAPVSEPAQLARLVATLPGAGIAAPLLEEIPGLVDGSGKVPLHSRTFADWMHRAFPMECPAPSNHKVTNPKTPDEWMEKDDKVADLEEMMDEIAQVLARYTTMGKKAGKAVLVAPGDEFDASTDVVRTRYAGQLVGTPVGQSSWSILGTIFRLAAMSSMVAFVVVAAKSGLVATGSPNDKKTGARWEDEKEFA